MASLEDIYKEYDAPSPAPKKQPSLEDIYAEYDRPDPTEKFGLAPTESADADGLGYSEPSLASRIYSSIPSIPDIVRAVQRKDPETQKVINEYEIKRDGPAPEQPQSGAYAANPDFIADVVAKQQAEDVQAKKDALVARMEAQGVTNPLQYVDPDAWKAQEERRVLNKRQLGEKIGAGLGSFVKTTGAGLLDATRLLAEDPSSMEPSELKASLAAQDFVKEEAAKLRQSAAKQDPSAEYADETILGYLGKGEPGKAAAKAGWGALQTVPQVGLAGLATYAGVPQLALSVLGTSVAGNKLAELEQTNPDMDPATMKTVAVANGIMEYLGEKTGTVNAWKRAIAAGGKEQVRRSARKMISDVLEPHAIEGGEEFVTQLGDNFVDVLAGTKRQDGTLVSMSDNLADSAIIGMAGGAPVSIVSVAKILDERIQQPTPTTPETEAPATAPSAIPTPTAQPSVATEAGGGAVPGSQPINFADPEFAELAAPVEAVKPQEAAVAPEPANDAAPAAEPPTEEPAKPTPALEVGRVYDGALYQGRVDLADDESYTEWRSEKTNGNFMMPADATMEEVQAKMAEVDTKLAKRSPLATEMDALKKTTPTPETDVKPVEAQAPADTLGTVSRPMAEAPSKAGATISMDAIRTAVSRRKIQGDALENAVDLARDLQEKGGRITPDGRVVMYHRTTPENAAVIVREQKMVGKEDGLFFGTQPSGQIDGYGDAIVEVEIPLEKLELNDVFTDEAHARMPTGTIGRKIPVVARSISESPREVTESGEAQPALPAPAPAKPAKTPKTPVGMKVTREYIKKATRKDLQYAMKKNELYPVTVTDQQMRSRLLSHMKDHGQIREMTPEEKAQRKAQFKANMRNGKQRKEWAGDEEAAKLSDMLLEHGLPEGTEVSVRGEEADFSVWRVAKVHVPTVQDISKNQLLYSIRNDITGDIREVSSKNVDIVEPTQEVDSDDVYGIPEESGLNDSATPEAGEKPAGSPAVDNRGAGQRAPTAETAAITQHADWPDSFTGENWSDAAIRFGWDHASPSEIREMKMRARRFANQAVELEKGGIENNFDAISEARSKAQSWTEAATGAEASLRHRASTADEYIKNLLEAPALEAEMGKLRKPAHERAQAELDNMPNLSARNRDKAEQAIAALKDIQARLEDAQFDDFEIQLTRDVVRTLDPSNPAERKVLKAHGITEDELNEGKNFKIYARTYDGARGGQKRTFVEVTFNPRTGQFATPKEIREEYGHILTRGAIDIAQLPMEYDEAMAADVAATFERSQAPPSVEGKAEGPNEVMGVEQLRQAQPDAVEAMRNKVRQLFQPLTGKAFSDIDRQLSAMKTVGDVYARAWTLSEEYRLPDRVRNSLDAIENDARISTTAPAERLSVRAESPKTGISIEAEEREREAQGFAERQKPKAVSDALREARVDIAFTMNKNVGSELVEKINNSGVPTALTTDETAILLREATRVNNELSELTKNSDPANTTARYDQLRQQRESIWDALASVRSEAGSTLRMYQFMMDADFTLSRMEYEMKKAKKDKLSDEEREYLKYLQKRYAETRKLLDEAKKQIEAEQWANEEAIKKLVVAEDLVKFLNQTLDSMIVKAKAKRTQTQKDQTAKMAAAALAQLEAVGPVTFERFSVRKEDSEPAAPNEDKQRKLLNHIALTVLDSTANRQQFNAAMLSQYGKFVKPNMLNKLYAEAGRAMEESVRAPGEAPAPKLSGVKALVRDYVEQHQTAEVDAVMAGVLKEIQANHPDMAAEFDTTDKIMDEFSDYGKTRFPTKDVLARRISDLRAQSQLLAKIRDVKARMAKPGDAGLYPKKRGSIMQPQTDKQRELGRTLADLLKQAKAKGIDWPDSGRALASALQASKTALQHQIRDLENAMKPGGTRIVRGQTLLVDDAEKIALRKQRDALLAQYKEMFPDQPLTDEQRRDIAIKHKQRQLEYWNMRRMEASLGRTELEKTEPTPLMPSLILDEMNAKIDSAKAEIEYLRNAELPTDEERRINAKIKRNEKTIEELKRRVQDKDFTPREKTEVDISNHPEALASNAMVEAIRTEYGLAKEAARVGQLSKFGKLAEKAGFAWNLARELASSGDFSAPGRQGFYAFWINPRAWARANSAMFKAGFSRQASMREAERAKHRVNWKNGYYAKSKLRLAKDDGQGNYSNVDERVRAYIVNKVPVVSGSNRAYATFLNNLRMDLFDYFLDMTGETKPSKELLKAIAEDVNIFTGAGSFVFKGKHVDTELIGQFIYAPSFLKASFDLLDMKPLREGRNQPELHKIMRRQYAKILMGIIALMALISWLWPDADFDWEPTSPQFGTFRVGNYRVGVAGFARRLITFAAQHFRGFKTTEKGRQALTTNPPPWTDPATISKSIPMGSGLDQVEWQFIKSKRHPSLGGLSDFAKGEDYAGRPQNRAAGLASTFLPITPFSVAQLAKTESAFNVLLLGLAQVLGGDITPDYNRPAIKEAMNKGKRGLVQQR
jgi:hypothetical protein